METYIHEETLEETLGETLDETIVYCDKCTTVFSSQKELEIHQNTRGRTIHTCQICLFASCSTNELYQHYQNSHTDLNYRGKKNILAGNVVDDLDNLLHNESTDHKVANDGLHQFQSPHIHEDLGRLSIRGGTESFKIHGENDNAGSNAKNDIIIGSTNLKQEDVKAEPIGLYTRSTIDAENIKTEPIENNEDSVAYEKNIVEQDDIKNFEAKLKSERLTTTPDLITTRKHKRNKEGTTLEIIEWGKPWGWGM